MATPEEIRAAIDEIFSAGTACPAGSVTIYV